MKHECKVTVLETKVFPDLQREYLADPESGPCPCFAAGQEFLFRREAGADDLALRARLGPGVPLRRGVGLHLALHLHGAAGRLHHARLDARRPPHGRLLQRTRPVVFKLERIDIPETLEEEAWLASQDFANTPEDAYTGEE